MLYYTLDVTEDQNKIWIDQTVTIDNEQKNKRAENEFVRTLQPQELILLC